MWSENKNFIIVLLITGALLFNTSCSQSIAPEDEFSLSSIDNLGANKERLYLFKNEAFHIDRLEIMDEEYPEISPNLAFDIEDESIATVNEDGFVVGLDFGITTLNILSKDNDTASINIVIDVLKIIKSDIITPLMGCILTDDGRLFVKPKYYFNTISWEPLESSERIKDIQCGSGIFAITINDDLLGYGGAGLGHAFGLDVNRLEKLTPICVNHKIKKVCPSELGMGTTVITDTDQLLYTGRGFNSQIEFKNFEEYKWCHWEELQSAYNPQLVFFGWLSKYLVGNDTGMYVMGDNSAGRLGLEGVLHADKYTRVLVGEEITDIIIAGGKCVVLMDRGVVYLTKPVSEEGIDSSGWIRLFINEDIVQISKDGVLTESGKYYNYDLELIDTEVERLARNFINSGLGYTLYLKTNGNLIYGHNDLKVEGKFNKELSN